MDERMQAIDEFRQHLERVSAGRRTSIDYVSDVRIFAGHCATPWREVKAKEIDAFVEWQRTTGLSAATVNRRVVALKVFFDYLADVSEAGSWANPVRLRRHRVKAAQRLPRDLSDELVARLWAVIERARDRAWFALMWRSGLRVSEVVGLNIGDVSREPPTAGAVRLRVLGKGAKERQVWVSSDAYAVVLAWVQERGSSEATAPLFVNDQGERLRANGIAWLLAGYSKAVGFHVTPHQLRHTFARQVTEAGMPVSSLSKLLGHNQITTTQIYTAGADPKLQAAYQTAMQQLAATPLAATPLPTTPLPPAVPPVPAAGAPVAAPVAPSITPPAVVLPAAAAWLPGAPPAIAATCLAYVQALLPQWKVQRRHTLSQRTLNELRYFWRWQLQHRPIDHLGQLVRQDLQAYQQARLQAGCKTTTINRTLRHVTSCLRFAADHEQAIDASIWRLQPLPVPEALPRHLSATVSQQLDALVAQRLDTSVAQLRLENALYFVLAHTGLRASECLDLLYQDLDLPAQRLTVRLGKGQRDRVVFLSNLATRALECYLAHQPRPLTAPLWSLPTGQPVTYGWLYAHLRRLGALVQIQALSPHQLRHTLATRLLNHGVDITRIQRILGHDYLTTTQLYARVYDATLEQDYRQAMRQIETQAMPLATTPLPVPAEWFQAPVPMPAMNALSIQQGDEFDNSI